MSSENAMDLEVAAYEGTGNWSRAGAIDHVPLCGLEKVITIGQLIEPHHRYAPVPATAAVRIRRNQATRR
jgi:hypothetical protein